MTDFGPDSRHRRKHRDQTPDTKVRLPRQETHTTASSEDPHHSVGQLENHSSQEVCGRGHRGASQDGLEDFISLGFFSLTDAAKGPTPIPNAAEAQAATSPALSH
jgi:hypothetical protein